MKTIEEIINLMEEDIDYLGEVNNIYSKEIISKEDKELLISIFEDLQQGHDKIALRSLNYEGDTYIREQFANIVLKFK